MEGLFGFNGITLPSLTDILSGIPNSVVEEIFRNSVVGDLNNALTISEN